MREQSHKYSFARCVRKIKIELKDCAPIIYLLFLSNQSRHDFYYASILYTNITRQKMYDSLNIWFIKR